MTGSPWKQKRCYVLSWETLGVCLEELRQCVAREQLPTVIVGIARGGLIPATFFASAIQEARLAVMSIARNRTDEIYSARGDPELAWMSPEARFEGERVLLVDDVTSSGKTLSFACDMLSTRGAQHVETAVVARMEGSAFVPNYVGVTLDDWIVFPWEITRPSGQITLIEIAAVLKPKSPRTAPS